MHSSVATTFSEQLYPGLGLVQAEVHVRPVAGVAGRLRIRSWSALVGWCGPNVEPQAMNCCPGYHFIASR